MKVLFLTSRLPYPPNRGDRLTAYEILRTLSQRHEVTLLSFVDGREPAGAREALAPFCRRIETVHLARTQSWVQAWLGLLSPEPSQVAFYRSAAMARAVRALFESQHFDVVFTQLIRMAPYTAALAHPAKVLFMADSIALALRRSAPFAPAWRQAGIHFERRRVEEYETRISAAFTESWVVSPIDREALLQRGCRNVRVVPHGVDDRLGALVHRPHEHPTVVFLGNLSVPHNLDAARFAAEQVWPHIRRSYPDARLVLAGADPGPALRALHGREGIEVPGMIPDLRALWERADVLLAPLRFATGIQNKVLEAMLAGVPVVTTPDVAAGIGATDTLVESAVTPHALAEAVNRLLSDPEAFTERRVRARSFVREHFRWENVEVALEDVARRSASTPSERNPQRSRA